MSETKKPSLTAALKAYFGLKPEQTVSEFLAEVRQIPQAERAEWAAMLEAAGYPCTY